MHMDTVIWLLTSLNGSFRIESGCTSINNNQNITLENLSQDRKVMPVNLWTPLACIAVAFLANLPMGYWRSITRKYSPAWFLAIHLTIPFIILVRIKLGLGYSFIPFSFAAAIAGQLSGGIWISKLAGMFGTDGSY